MSWARRADNIQQRDWGDLLGLWSDFSAGFDTATYLNNSLERAVESITTSTSLAGNNINILEFEDRASFVSELVFSQVKANHALVCAAKRITSGNATWGVIDAYHASMLLMRSILAAFGIFVCRVHDRNVLVDAFPWLGRVDAQKSFKRQHRNWNRCVAIISSTTRYVEQSDLFALFQRVLNISTVPTNVWPEVVVRNILDAQKTHFSNSRNQLIYGSRFWFNPDDLLGECLSLHWNSLARRSVVAYAFAKVGITTEIDCYCDTWMLFLMSTRLHNAIYASLSDSLGVLSYVDDRKSDIVLIERQFHGQF
jgi:hypothetical protein